MIIEFRCYGYRGGGTDYTLEKPFEAEVTWGANIPVPSVGEMIDVRHEKPEREHDMHIWDAISQFRVVKRAWRLDQGAGYGASYFVFVLWLAHKDHPDAA